jgi:hypothetical protein
MNLPLHFSIESPHTLDVLEAVLAIARRGGLQLGQLELRGQHVYLDLQAGEQDLLDLFLTRLHNVIGVGAIEAHC